MEYIGHMIDASFIGSTLGYKLLDSDYNEINIGDSVKIYVNKEITTLQNNNGMISIDDVEIKYWGKISNGTLLEQKGFYLLFNEVDDNFLDTVNNITLFEGVLDFDTIVKNKPSKNLKPTVLAIGILTLLFIFFCILFIFFIPI